MVTQAEASARGHDATFTLHRAVCACIVHDYSDLSTARSISFDSSFAARIAVVMATLA